ncbi:MAG TPA: molybdenum cofactor biosynthesis protein MoaB [Myxococcales bacterium]|nr:molybdenum cofactor biosynthesis protein MoaB [Myxococcales bacterium]HIK85264.1 molybdenum cofactor biosynthesis protein MoaB [Myxococcales bacterium]
MSDRKSKSPADHGHHHRQAAPSSVPTAIVTVSDTRTLETDTGGALVEEMLAKAGQSVTGRRIVPDEPEAIRAALDQAISDSESRAVIFTGGTGVAARDVTPDVLAPEFDRSIPGFGELFRMLSYEEIGSAALLSRALAGLKQGKIVFVIPGSRGAVRLAMEKLILPELGHLAGETQKKT